MSRDKLDRKINEAVGLTRRRRDRRDPIIDGLTAPHKTGDPFCARLFENERTERDGRIMEQPERPVVEPEAPPEQDVLVSPEGEPVPGVDVPEEPPEDEVLPEEPETDPESQIEEQKRALFNTLSELIDLGRIERSEIDIRSYCEEHEDEIGDLLDVIDDVIEMLIMDAEIVREPQTFDDDGEEEEVESTPGQKGYDELKPGVGGQVSKGITNTSVISSDQSKSAGQKLSEELAVSRLISGDNVEAVLDATMSEEVIELTFNDDQDRDQALARMEKIDVPSTNLMKVGGQMLHVIRDDRNRADVEQQMSALDNLEFQQSIEGQAAEVEEQGEEQDDVDVNVQYDEEPSPEDLAPMTELWQEITFSQGDSASEVLDMIENEGPETALDYLAEMGHTDLQGETSNDAPWGDDDEVFHDEGSGLTLSWNSKLGYFGLQRKVSGEAEAQEFGAMESAKVEEQQPAKFMIHLKGTPYSNELYDSRGSEIFDLGTAIEVAKAQYPNDEFEVYNGIESWSTGEDVETQEFGAAMEAKKKNALVPSEREKDCPHNLGAWSGEVPNTGTFKCKMCGTELDPKTKKPVGATEAEGQYGFEGPGIGGDVKRLGHLVKKAIVGSHHVTHTNDQGRYEVVDFHDEESANKYADELRAKNPNSKPKVTKSRSFGGAATQYVNEEVNINRTGLAVQVAFNNQAQAAAAKGALLQYKGIDVVIEADDHNIVAFTTDSDPEEARKRVETILSNARLPMESEEIKSLKMEIYETVTEAGEEPLGFRYGGADLLPAPVPVGHGTSGADEDEPDPDNPEGRDYPGETGGDTSLEYNGFPVWRYYVDEVIESLPVSDDTRTVLLGTSQGQEAYNMRLEEIWNEIPEATKDDIAQAYNQEFGADASGGAVLGSVEEQMGPVATPDEQKYLIPFHAPDDAVPTAGDELPDNEPAESADASVMWRMDVPESNEEYQRLEGALNSAKDQGLLSNWSYVAPEGEELAPPDEGPAAEPPPEDMTPDAQPITDDWEDQGDSGPPGDMGGEPEVQSPEPGAEPEPMPGEVGAFIAVEFAPETEQEEREAFSDWILQETEDEASGIDGVLIDSWEELMPEDDPNMGELEPGVEPPSEEIIEPAPSPVEPSALAHGPTEAAYQNPELYGKGDPIGKHQIKRATKDIQAPKASWNEEPGENPDDLFGDGGQADVDWGAQTGEQLPPNIQQLLTAYQAAQKTEPEKARQLAGQLKFEMGTAGIDPRQYGITEGDEDDEGVPPIPDVSDDPFDKAYEPAVRQTTGGGAEPAEEGCPTPGRKIRSKGRGRGLARGKGRGPIGRSSKA